MFYLYYVDLGATESNPDQVCSSGAGGPWIASAAELYSLTAYLCSYYLHQTVCYFSLYILVLGAPHLGALVQLQAKDSMFLDTGL